MFRMESYENKDRLRPPEFEARPFWSVASR